MGLFNKNQGQEVPQISQRQRLENRYNGARNNILWVLLFTAINIVLSVTNSNSYFLFSAFIPYAIVDTGMYWCGKYPVEYYDGSFENLDPSALVIFIGIAVVICVLYLLCWLLSKKRRVAWMIVALVFFAIDTILMILNGISADMILDVVFHGWVVISLSMGISAHFKLKKLPEEEPVVPVQPEEEPVAVEALQE